MNRSVSGIKHIILVAVTVCLCIMSADAIPVDHYAASSRLSAGRWRKVEVTETGMQLITNAQLKLMGFTDPSKVNVYGYGGRRISDVLNASSYVDDLPVQPVVRTSDGILFYGVNTVSWRLYGYPITPFRAIQNPYSTKSYYFVSDVAPEEEYVMPELDSSPVANISQHTTTYLERLLHEKDIFVPSNTGEWCLGEDFTQQNSQEFKFTLPGLTEGPSAVLTGFGVRSTLSSKYKVSINGEVLEEQRAHTIPKVERVEDILKYLVCSQSFVNPTKELTVGIEYTPSGVVTLARLGSIVVYYTRELSLNDGPFIFYTPSNYNPSCVYEISGAGQQTQIWDVTDPAAPVRVRYKLEGGKALFSPTVSNYREYAVFNPEQVSLNPKVEALSVTNQDLHSVATPDMVIITPKEYMEHARRIGELHDRLEGLDTYIVTPEALYNEFSSGSPDLMAYRKALKMWYDRNPEKLKYVLILGRPTYDHRQISDVVRSAGYPRPLIWQTPGEDACSANVTDYASELNSYSTDDYIVMLEDNISSFSIGSAKLSVAVGRMPFISYSHATQMVDKLERYMEQPDMGSWRNSVTMISDNGNEFAHFEQMNSSYDNMVANGGENFLYEKIYLSGEEPTVTSSGNEYPYSRQRMLYMIDKGTGLIWYIGHGNPRELTHERIFTYTDAVEMTNKYFPVFYTATCEYSRWDSDDLSAGEIVWSHSDAGAIAMLTTSREVIIGANKSMTDALAANIFAHDATGNAITLGEALRLAKNRVGGDNKLRYMLIGDPAMRVINPLIRAKVENIGGFDPDTLTGPDYPVFKGGSRVPVSGTVMRGNNIAADFNGIIYLTLFDAERALTTVDPDPGSRDQINYNLRTNRVYEGRAKVVNGRWETEILLSTDIENNYSPASLTLYAYSEKGVEANGNCESFYLYGMEENNTDTEGPEITGMGLNTYNFQPGQHVSPNPVFYASFRDPSGINLASAGVGHEMILSIDGKNFYTDVRDYYAPSIDDIHAGTVSYPLADLEPGRHTLEFTVCDNLGNYTVKSLDFAVTVNSKPTFYEVTTDCNPAYTSVTFTLAHDRLREATDCTISVYDLSGRRIWSGKASSRTDIETGTTVTWDLCDGSGRRVPRGIYLYRATVETSEGISVSKTGKLAVASQ